MSIAHVAEPATLRPGDANAVVEAYRWPACSENSTNDIAIE